MSDHESPKIHELTWDSELFGFRCGMIDFTTLGTTTPWENISRQIGAIVRKGRLAKYRFLTSKVPSEMITISAGCQANGGFLVDTEMSFYKKASNCQINTTPTRSFWIGKGFMGKRDLVEGAVASTHQSPPISSLQGEESTAEENRCRSQIYRPTPDITVEKHQIFWDDIFYQLPTTLYHNRFFVDPNIKPTTARKLWETSIYNSCTGRASYTIVGLFQGHPAGLINVFEKGSVSDIFLIAVLSEFQGRGLGLAMMEFYEMHLDENIKEQLVETQVVNYPAQKLYTLMGYFSVRAKYIFHFWL